MSAKIEKIKYLNEKGYKISNNNYEAVVLPEKGANLIKLYNKKLCIDVLREPKNENEFAQKKYEYGVPVLFFPNRIKDGKFLFNKHEYQFPINDKKTNCHLHGFLYDKKWNVKEIEIKGEIVFISMNYELDKSNEVYKYFPHKCEFNISFILTEGGLRQEMKITNKGENLIPIGLGYHTSFYVPFKGRYKVFLTLDKRWEINDRFIPTGVLHEINNENEIYIDRKGKKIFGHFLLKENIIQDRKYYGAIVENKDKKYKIYYLFDKSFKHVVVWNKNGDEDFISIEPQTCAINALNIDMPYNITGVRFLGKDEMFEANTFISIEI